MIVDIESLADPRLQVYVGLRDALARRQTGQFVAEGELVVRRAVAAGLVPASFLLAPRWVEELRPVWEEFDVPVFSAPFAEIEALTGFHVHRGVLASFVRPPERSVAEVVSGRQRVVVVQDLVDHANLGTIARTCAALGWDALVVGERAADPLYRRAVKASMGAVLTLPWARSVNDQTLVAELQGLGFHVLAMALDPAAVELGDVRAEGPVALLLGSEGPGLTRDWVEAADQVVRIDMAAGIDSLNVGAAAAVACWALRP